jgi:hypothetical protein
MVVTLSLRHGGMHRTLIFLPHQLEEKRLYKTLRMPPQSVKINGVASSSGSALIGHTSNRKEGNA